MRLGHRSREHSDQAPDGVLDRLPATLRLRGTRGVAAQHASLSRWRSPVRIRSGPPGRARRQAGRAIQEGQSSAQVSATSAGPRRAELASRFLVLVLVGHLPARAARLRRRPSSMPARAPRPPASAPAAVQQPARSRRHRPSRPAGVRALRRLAAALRRRCWRPPSPARPASAPAPTAPASTQPTPPRSRTGRAAHAARARRARWHASGRPGRASPAATSFAPSRQAGCQGFRGLVVEDEPGRCAWRGRSTS